MPIVEPVVNCCILLQDGASIHTAKTTIEYCNKKEFDY